jgi:D-sedoheptulose 7-phosphate isomerase
MDAIDTYLTEVQTAVAELSRPAIRLVVDVLQGAWERSGTTYIVGNGGSASTASHMMNDLMKFTSVDSMRRFRAVSLADNVPLITALGNDLEYAEVFVEQLKNLLLPGDVLIAISGSGNYPNIIKAIEYAKSVGATTVGLTGRPGGKLAQIVDLKIVVPADRIGQQEDGHLILNHVIATALRERIIAAGAVGASRG